MKINYCKECGAEPAFGIRVHPRYSLKVGMVPEILLTAIYAHDAETILAVRDRLTQEDMMMEIEEWNGSQWVEFKDKETEQHKGTK